ncbi:MAG: oxygen-independent coproporphyrinogen III oxidase-like protein [Burkholderiales bacterium]|nr:oxygen-independent coproporphyrinogen III oxidase-like protein [Burkholderiales bacterium]
MSVVTSPPTRAGIQLKQLPPLALYVHIPWCIRKCPYCDFNSHEAREAIPESRYVDALIADLEQAVPTVYGREIHTVFFGGGTPSLFSPESFDRFLSAVRAILPLRLDAEITLEANPGTFEAGKFAAFRALGINRLSIGIQSFDAKFLKALGRVHDDAEAHRAIDIARASFDNFNVDLMYALPGQSIDEALADIAVAVDTGAPHVSAYHLTIEPNTYFHRYPPSVPDDDVAATMQERIEARLDAAGYRHYETSAFAQPGREARHNVNYWQFGDYLGIGAGAHGKLSLRDRIFRQMRHRHPRDYMDKALAGNAIQTEQDVTPAELPFEFMMNALRLTDGVPAELYAARTGLPLHAIRTSLDQAETLALLERDHATLRPTLKGQRFLNELLQIFL